MNQPNKHANKPLFVKTLLSVMVAMSAAGVQAQSSEIEEVVIIGEFQRNLQNALDIKRDAATIVDGISADDIDSLPALDLGEALQAVPGVQLNREGERRESSINLRGLPSGFIKITANGQSVAVPSRGSNNDIFGAANPFGAYDASIFNGINVVKTQDASMQAGGIAGAVDQRLPRALSADNGGSIRVGVRHESLSNENNAEIGAKGSYHFIEDVLAVSGAIGWSEQLWRRDSIRSNRYSNITDGNFAQGSSSSATIADYRAANNLAPSAVITFPSEARQVSEINEGTRLSFSGNIEFQPTDALKLGASIIFTDRDMDDNRLEQLELRSRDFEGVGVAPVGEPIFTGELDDDGSPVYLSNQVELFNTEYYYDNRRYAFLQESQAIILDAEWTSDNWTIDGAITVSDASNTWDEILLSPRSGRGNPGGDAGSFVDAVFFNGGTQPSSWSLDATSFDQSINFDQNNPDGWVFGRRDSVTNSGAIPASTASGRVRQILLTTGTFEVVENGLDSLEANFERAFGDEGLTAISFGLRESSESLDSSRVRVSGAGIEANGIFTNAGRTAPEAEGSFFGGNIGNAAGVDDGWYSFDFDSVNRALLATIPDDLSTLGARGIETPVRLPNGYIARGNELGKGFDFDSELDITALYVKADFADEVLGKQVSGNVGLRYVDTRVETVAPVFQREGSVITSFEGNQVDTNDYSHVLPSLNVNISLTEDLIFRAAYNETFVRPNLRATSPQAQITTGSFTVDEMGTPDDTSDDVVTGQNDSTIRLAGSDVDPFEAKSLDASLEWYNTEGGLISIAWFNKTIDNYFDRLNTCSGTEELGFSDVEIDAAGNCVWSETTASTFAGEEVGITQWVNTDATLKIRGIEASIQQKLDFLPYPWNGFGGVLNFTESSQSSDAGESGEDVEIFGISDTSYNVIAFYEQNSFGVKLTYNWRSDYDIIATNTLFGTGGSTVNSVGRTDISAYYRVTDDIKVSLKGFNLTEEIYEEYEGIEQQMRRADFEGRTWVLSASYKF